MSWWKKALKVIGLGGKVYGEVRTAKDPNGKTGRMVSAGADVLLGELERSETPPEEKQDVKDKA